MLLKNFKLFFLFLLTFTFSYAEQFSDSFRLDGYLNLDFSESKQNNDSFKPSAGIQGRYSFNDKLSVTSQVHFEEGANSEGRISNSLKDYESELKWLYLDYYLENDFTFRTGAFQFPVFKSSETGDIGYTYTWTETPLSFYGVFGCDDFQGVELLKKFSYKDFDFLAQLSYGKSNNELNDGRGNSKKGDVDNLLGLTLKTSHDYFILNAGYLQAESNLDIVNAPFLNNSSVDFSMFALESEVYIDAYTLKLGLIKTRLNNIFPESLNYYGSLEYSFGDFTPYILYSKEGSKFKDPINQAPPPQSPIPSFAPSLEGQYKEKYSLGLRYDYSSNIAFKVSFTHDINVIEFDIMDEKRHENRYVGTINVVF